MRPLYIFDIDGTLSLLGERRKILDETASDRWDRFYEACGEDKPNIPVLRILNLLIEGGNEVWLFSGRRESCRNTTLEWLSSHVDLPMWGFYSDRIMLRPNGDSTKDDVLKESWLNNMLDVDRNRLVAVFDDRQRVVDMWRRNGITCFQVAEGQF